MSLTTVTIALDNKLRSLRNSSLDSDHLDLDDKVDDDDDDDDVDDDRHALSLGENIPYADESPERPLIQVRSKPQRSIGSTSGRVTTASTTPISCSSSPQSESSQENVIVLQKKNIKNISSDETDASTTSNTREILPAMRIDTEVLREMNRILTNLERKATKLNRSLSLNYKNHKGDCCCNNTSSTTTNHRGTTTTIQSNRFSLTKDEKTDKNISKKRQLQDIKNHRRSNAGNRSIKRRHTVGGTHDYSSTKIVNEADEQQMTNCQGFVVTTRTSSPDLAERVQICDVVT